MKKQQLMKRTGLCVFLTAMLILCAAVLGMTAFGKSSVVNAEGEFFVAPLEYEYVAPTTEGEGGSYTVKGVDVTDKAAWTAAQKDSVKIVIPAVYDDNEHGEAPVTAIADKAFSAAFRVVTVGYNPNNDGLVFRSVDFSAAVNLKSIGAYAFYRLQYEGRIEFPVNLEEIGASIFGAGNVTGLVMNENLERVHYSSFAHMTNFKEEVFLPEKFCVTASNGNISYANLFYDTPVKNYIVAENNPNYTAIDGVLYSKDGTVLMSYPGGKKNTAVFRVPASVSVLDARSFESINNVEGLILHAVTEVKTFAFTTSSLQYIYVSAPEKLTSFAPTSTQSFNGKIVVRDGAAFAAATNTGGVLASVKSQVTYINNVSAAFDAGSDTISLDANAEQLKPYFSVTGDTESGITGIPIDDFTLTLPAGGLVVGSNEITVAVGGNSATTNIMIKATPAPPAAPVVSGTPSADSITLETIEGAEYSKDNGATWQDSPTFTGLAPNTDYAFIARIKPTDTAYASANSLAVRIRTDKAAPAAPAAPVVSGTPSADGITLETIEGAEYSKDNGATWQDSPTFTGLAPNTEYTFLVRIKATDTAYASANSPAVRIRTDKVTPAAPAAPVVSGTPSADSITLETIEGAEYSKDNGATWQDSPTFTGLAPNTEYAFIARIKPTDNVYASAVSEAITIKTAALPDKGGLTGGAIAGIVIGCVAIAGIGGFAVFWFVIKKQSIADLTAIFKKK